MEKLFIFTAFLVLAATSCFADEIASGATGTMKFTAVGLELHAADAATGTATNSTALIGKASTGVSVGWMTSVGGYALVTQHQNGTKGYGSSYDSTSLFQYAAEVAPGDPALAVPTATDTTDFTIAKGWKAM